MSDAAGIVFFQGTLYNSGGGTPNVHLGNLPVGMRPSKIKGTQSSANEYTLRFFDSKGSIRSFRIDYDTGAVRCYVGSEATTTFHGMFFTDDALE